MDVETVSRQIHGANSVLLCTRVEISLAVTVVQNMVDQGLRVGPYIPSKQVQLVGHLHLTRGEGGAGAISGAYFGLVWHPTSP